MAPGKDRAILLVAADFKNFLREQLFLDEVISNSFRVEAVSRFSGRSAALNEKDRLSGL